jgi:hypothetical protein
VPGPMLTRPRSASLATPRPGGSRPGRRAGRPGRR